MSKMFDQLAEELFQILKGYGKTLSLFDDNGKKVYEPSDARRMFAEPDKLMMSIDEEDSNSEVKLFLSQSTDTSKIEKLINSLRHLTTRFNVLFSVRKYSRELSPKDFAYQSLPVTEDSILESLYGFQKTSYQKINSSRLVVRHSKNVNEEKRGSRTRNINTLFVENNKGERFKFPLVHLSGARAWAQHLSQNGTPFDNIGQHIVELATESSKLLQVSKHILNNRSSLDESTLELRVKIKERILEIRKTLGRLSGVRGYVKETKNINFDNKILEDQTVFDEYKRLGILLGITEDNPLSESLMPVVLLIKGENMNKNNVQFHRVVALENADDLVETLINEYGYKEGSSWKKSDTGITFLTPEAFDDAKSYLELTESQYFIEDAAVNPNDKVLMYAQKWVAKAGGTDLGHVGDDWSPSDKKAIEGKAFELAQGLKEILSGRLSVKPVPAPPAKAANPRAAMALKIGRLLAPQAGMQNDMLHNYLSAIHEKLGSHENLSPVETQVATKAASIVDSMSSDNDVAENVWNEDSDGQYSEDVKENDQVSTPMGPGIVVHVDNQGIVKVKLQSGISKRFWQSDVEKNNLGSQNTDSLKEIAELDEWFESFNPDKVLTEEPDVHIHVQDNDSGVEESDDDEDHEPMTIRSGRGYGDPDHDDSAAENAIQTAVHAFNIDDFFKYAGKDFDWDQRHFNQAEPEDMQYDASYIESSIIGFLHKLADNHANSDWLQDDDFKSEAQNIFNTQVKPEMEKEGYTFSGGSTAENIDDDIMSSNSVIPGDIQHDFGQDVRSQNIHTPGESESDHLARLRHLAGI